MCQIKDLLAAKSDVDFENWFQQLGCYKDIDNPIAENSNLLKRKASSSAYPMPYIPNICTSLPKRHKADQTCKFQTNPPTNKRKLEVLEARFEWLISTNFDLSVRVAALERYNETQLKRTIELEKDMDELRRYLRLFRNQLSNQEREQ